MSILVYVLTLVACFAFGATVPHMVTDSALGQIVVAAAGGLVIGAIGLAVESAF